MVGPPQRSRGVSFREQLSELIADHSAEIEAAEVSQSLQELSQALESEPDEPPPSLTEPSNAFERELSELVERHADLADDWARLTRTLSDLAADLQLAGSDASTLSTDSTYRRTDDGHLLTITYPAPFLMLRAVETLAEVGGLVVEGRISIPILSSVELRVTCEGVDKSVELNARVVQQDDDVLSLDVDLDRESAAIRQLRLLAHEAATAREDASSERAESDAASGAQRPYERSETPDDLGEASSQPLPPGSRAPKTPGTTASPFDLPDEDRPNRQPPAGHSPRAAIMRRAHAPSATDTEDVGVGNRDRRTRRGRRLLDALNSLYTRVQQDNYFDVLGLDWTANGANVRNAHRSILGMLDKIADLPLSKTERSRLREIEQRVRRAAKVLGHSRSRRQYRASQIDTDRFIARLEELETRLAARVLRDDDAGARKICAQLLELDPSHPNARYHKQRLD